MLHKRTCNVNNRNITINVMNGEIPDSKEVWRLFGPWLREQRNKSGKSRKHVANAVGIHPVQLARIESGDSGTRKDTLDALISELKLDPEETYKRAGLWPEGMPVPKNQTVEQALRQTNYFNVKGLSDADIAVIRPILEALDKQVERLTETD